MILSLENPDSEDLCNQKYDNIFIKLSRNLSISNGFIWINSLEIYYNGKRLIINIY